MEWNKIRGSAWLLLVLIPGILGCYTYKSLTYKPGIPPEAQASLNAALKKYSRSEPEAFASELTRLLREYPSFVEAHRHLQNLYLQDYRYGYLLNRYRTLLDQHPDHPAYHYLYGRISSEPYHQLDAFDRSVELDRSFFWGYNGLGYAYTALGDFQDGEEAYQQAIHSAPARVEPYIGLLNIYLTRKHYEELENLLRKAHRLFPDDLSIELIRCRYIAEREGPITALAAQLELPVAIEPDDNFYLFMLNLLDRASSERIERRIVYRFGPLADTGGHHPVVLDLVLGVCLKRLGNLNGAGRHFLRVHEKAKANARARRELRYLYAIRGMIREAHALQVSDCPPSWLEASRYSAEAQRMFELSDRIVGQRDFSSVVPETLELSNLFIRLGWLEEAAHYLHCIADLPGGAGEEAIKRLEEIYRHLSFELKLHDYFLHQYADYRADGISSTLDEALEELGTISNEILGFNVFENVAMLDFWPAGELMDPRRATHSGPAEYFKRYNRFFLMGQKSGGPVEAYLLDVFDYQPGYSAPQMGVALSFDLIRCENLRIPSYIEYSGGSIAGAALHSFVFINLDSIRHEVGEGRSLYQRFKDKEELLLDDPPPRAADEEQALEAREPLGLAQRLKYLSYKKHGAVQGDAAYMADRFDTIMAHEVQHLVDARKFLPFWPNLFWNLYYFVAMGFSPFRVESWLEERSQMHALVASKDAYAALAVTVSHLGGGPIRTAHQQGYYDLLVRIVEYIYEHPDRYPTVDRAANILHQLYRLSEEEIQEIAQRLAEMEELETEAVTPHPAAG